MKRRHLCLVGAVAAAAALAPATAQAATERVYLQFNMAGNTQHGGDTAVADAVANSVEDRKPSVVTLNEVCGSQYARLKERLADDGYDSAAGPTGPTCDNGTKYGNAIFVHNSVREYANYQLPKISDESEPRRMLCVAATEDKSMACVTHLSKGEYEEERKKQIEFVAGKTQEFSSAGYRVIVGGDFNTEPRAKTIDPMFASCYRPKGSGELYEAASERCGRRAGEATTDHGGTDGAGKIDYLFFSGEYRALSADAVPVGVSDHHLLWAKASR
ncbi:endonuclease/exonuclease/phosphatase family protein [Amycolatopsis jiangsuensis]|uniref:Endonuclease/exonuclease/phosphatase family metal-dependent hydrolase n=1 Tax=Amycolatopsis jiangsuensis TaxID=1181879 RepID=A0A840J114_9PSEU|nr:endonuclease/exonuclease/phosphatase family protein [Amycolatopsis jiangsuensis]MBB4687112.1 endonuclease/exonuclease/phosphatase family metal-dependent hydrolase [Amycolatopsis jiangsuensis]